MKTKRGIRAVIRICSDTMRIYRNLNVNDRNLKRTNYFKYLESILSERNAIQIELTERIRSGNKWLYGLAKSLGSARSLLSNVN